MTWGWLAFTGVILLVAILFSLRLMRRGYTSLEKDRAHGLERIRQEEAQLRREQNSITAGEHFRVAHAGLADLLRLAGNPPGIHLEMENTEENGRPKKYLRLHLPEEDLRISVGMRVTQPLSSPSGRGGRRMIWHLQRLSRDMEFEEDYDDLVPLMHTVHTRLTSCLADTPYSRPTPEQ